MTERETADLLRAATSDLDPDVDLMVTGGMARGRVRRRRRRATTGVVALAAIAVLGAGAGLTLGGGEDRAIDPASPSGTAEPTGPDGSASPRPDSPGSPDSPDTSADTSESGPPPGDEPYERQPRELAIRASAILETFAALEPGRVRLLGDKENPMDGYETRDLRYEQEADEPPPGIIADFTWNGAAIRVAVTPTMPEGDSPLERCRSGGNGGCAVRAEGGVLQENTDTGPAVDGGVTTSFVTFYTPDKWQVFVGCANAGDFDGEIVSERPPFTLDELAEIATDDVWFAS